MAVYMGYSYNHYYTHQGVAESDVVTFQFRTVSYRFYWKYRFVSTGWPCTIMPRTVGWVTGSPGSPLILQKLDLLLSLIVP